MSRRSTPAPVAQGAGGSSSGGWHAVALVGALAFAIRLLYLFEIRDSVFTSVLIGDSLEYDAWALRIAGGDWVGREVFYQSPLYPYLLAVFYKIAGHHVFGVRLLQAVLGSLSCALLAIAGRRFFDSRTGLVAGLLLAFYPAAIFFDGLIQKSSVDLVLVTALLAALGACVERRRRGWIVAAGVAFAALALNRENARVLYPVIAGWFLLFHRHDSLPQRVARAAIFTAAAAALLLPVAVRNRAVGGELLISTSQFGPNFYIGNHAGATGGYEEFLAGRGNAAYERADATRLAEQAAGRTLTPGEVSDYWWRRALGEIRQDPGAWLRLLARKTWMTFAAEELVDTESLEAYSSESLILRALKWFSFGIVVPLALFGAWVTRADWRRLVILYAACAALALSIVIFYVFARYRFPLVPFVLLFAGAAVARATAWATWRPASGTWGPALAGPFPALAVCAVLAVLLHIPVRTSSDQTWFNYGSVLLKDGRAAEALPLLRRAVAADPSHLDARIKLASALQQTNQSAVEELRQAVRLDPARAQSHLALAIALHREGRLEEAIAVYKEALRLRPDSVEALSNLAIALNERGDPADAVILLERALAIQPQNPGLRVNLMQAEYALGQKLALAGQVAGAIAHFERARSAAVILDDTTALASIDQALLMLRRR